MMNVDICIYRVCSLKYYSWKKVPTFTKYKQEVRLLIIYSCGQCDKGDKELVEQRGPPKARTWKVYLFMY